MHKLAILGLIAFGFSVPSAHATFLHVPKFTVRTLTSDGVPVNGAVTRMEIAGLHGGYRFFCGVPGFVYPCVDWDGYFDYVKQFELTTDASGVAIVADHRYPFSSTSWREPEIRLWIEGVLIPECSPTKPVWLRPDLAGMPGSFSPNIPDGGCVSKQIDGKDGISALKGTVVDCPLGITKAEFDKLVQQEIQDCKR